MSINFNSTYNLRIVFFLFLTFFAQSKLYSQEKLSPLSYDKILNNYQYTSNEKVVIQDSLPFFDDFSDSFVQPSSSRWTDKMVFINTSFAINPLSLGVATFDGLDGKGRAYQFGSGPTVFGTADTLTSVPLRLGSYLPSDSIVLSFYIQPQGIGFAPARKDSFLVDFKNPQTNKWSRVYFREGSSFNTFKNLVNADFLLVSITIKDTAYLKDGFQFRFKNKANRTGNNDHWNLDYVKVDRQGFNPNELNDIAISTYPTSILDRYDAMPWNQVTPNDLADNSFVIRNSFTDPKSLTNIRYYPIDEITGDTLFLFPGEGLLLNPLSYQSKNYGTFQLPPFNNELGRIINLKVDLQNNGDLYPQNDTVLKRQNFGNYYAYDDGSAEANYGLESTGSRLAYKFNLNNQDTLRAVDMYFTQLDKDVTLRTFSIAVWKDLIQPPVALFPNQTPDYSESLDGFVRYDFPQEVILSGEFYIGWIQNSIDQLNIGFDLNNDNQQYIFKNTTGTWDNTLFPGSLMIRPVFSESSDLVSLPTNLAKNDKIKLYPNPASNIISITLANQNVLKTVTVFDINGKLMQTTLSTNIIDISEYNSGVYFIHAIDVKGEVFRSKFVKITDNE